MPLTFFRISSKFAKILFLVVLLPFVFVRCKDLIEVDLTNKQLLIIAPSDSLQSSIQSVYFKWEHLEGATVYRIQIVSPDFNNILQFISDSAIVSNNFLYTLQPGSYEWRIRAENSSSSSAYQYRKLFIDSTSGLSNQIVVLSEPIANVVLNDETIQFSWQALFAATEYTIKVNDQQSGNVLYNQTINNTEHAVSALPEGVFIWEVRALNSSSSTAYSSRQIRIDRTAPFVPVPVTPESVITDIDTIRVHWQRLEDTGVYQSPRFDRFYVYSDTLSNPISGFPIDVDTTYIDLTLALPNNYFWRLMGVDEAGNESNYTNFRQITRQ